MPSQDDMAVVCKFTDGLRAGDVAGCLDLVHDDLVFSEAPSLPFGGDYLGKSGFVQFLRTFSRDFRVELGTPEITAGDAFVAVRVRGTMTSRSTDRSMPMEVVDLYEVRAGKIARVDVFYKDTAAVVDLGRPGLSQDENGSTQ